MRLSIVHKFFIVFCVFVLSINTVFAQDDFLAPFVGSGYVKGTDSTLGEVELYVPINSKGSWGTSDTGYLYNVSSTGYSGVLYTQSGTKYIVSASGFALPRYRLPNSSSYDYSDLHLSVSDSNLQVATDFSGVLSITESILFIMVGFMGVILFFMMRYKR